MNPENYEIAKVLKKRLSKVVPLIDFRVFAPKEHEEKDESPDMEVFIEVEYLDKELKEKISDIVWDVGYEYLTVISYVIFTKDEIENPPLGESSTIRKFIEKGIRI